LERECLGLVADVAALEDRDPTEVIARDSEWNGRRKVNPAGMSDDRLLNTVLDLRKRKAALQPKPQSAPAYRIVSTEEAEAAARLRREERGGGRRPGAGAAPGEAGPDPSDEGADRGAAAGAGEGAGPEGATADGDPSAPVDPGIRGEDGASAAAGAGNRSER
jgi:hypothetical protein